MAYIPEEHKKYPVLPRSRENGGEVFQYGRWPAHRLMELVGEHLIPYGYESYEQYFEKIDRIIREHPDEPETVRLLEECKENISFRNKKEDWSICKYLGDDAGDIPGLGLTHGNYYYWPCTTPYPEYVGVIDDEEFTAYLYPTDPDLWEIIVDPTGMAARTIYEGENAFYSRDFEHISAQFQNMRQENLKDTTVIGPADRLNACKKVHIRTVEKRNTFFVVPFKIYDATVLEDGDYLFKDETGKANVYAAEDFETLTEEDIRELKKTERYKPHTCPACGCSEFPMQESYEVCRICGWADVPDGFMHLHTPEEHGRLYREGKIFFREWRDVMPRGVYYFRSNLQDGYMFAVFVDEDSMTACSLDHATHVFSPDVNAWDVLDRLHGNMSVSNTYFAEYCRDVEKNAFYVWIPTAVKEDGAVRDRVPDERGEEPMIFDSYIDYDENETLARVRVPAEELEVPVNISLDKGSDMNLKTGDLCEAALWSNDYEVQIFASDDEYRKAGTQMAPVSMIPMGTFSPNPDQEDFQQNAMILFTGFVREAERNPEPEDGAPIWRIRIETYGLIFDLYYFKDEPVEPGYLVHGRAWLYGEVHKVEDEIVS